MKLRLLPHERRVSLRVLRLLVFSFGSDLSRLPQSVFQLLCFGTLLFSKWTKVLPAVVA